MGDEENLPEVSIGGELTETGFSASARSRAITAIDRLVGELIDIPTTSIAAFNQRRKARAEIREAMIRRVGEKAIDTIQADPGAIDSVVDRMVSEELRKQENKERVAELAIEDLRVAPPKDDDVYNEEEFVDWMNVFSRYAQDASSERLQNLWAKVLAGQIRKDRAFSFGTLRLLSEFDPEVAKHFQEILEYRIDDQMLVSPQTLEGEEMLKWLSLEEAGFLSSPFGLNHTVIVNDAGWFFIEARNMAVRGKATPGKEIQLPCKMLTKPSLEVASILPKNDGVKAAEMIAAKKAILDAASKLEIALITGRSTEGIHTTTIRTIKTHKTAE